MKVLRKGLRMVLWGGLALLVGLVSVLVVVWTWPQVLFNTRNLTYAAKFLHARGIELSWGEAELEGRSASFWVKQVHLRVRDLSLQSSALGCRSRIQSIQIGLTADLTRGSLKIHLGPSEFTGAQISLRPPPSPEEVGKKSSDPQELWPRLPPFLGRVTFETFRLDVQKFEYWTNSVVARAAGSLEVQTRGPGSEWNVSLQGTVRSGQDRYRATGKVRLDSTASPWFGPYHVVTNWTGQLPAHRKVNVRLQATPEGASDLVYVLNADFRDGRKHFVGTVMGRGSMKAVGGVVNASALKVSQSLPSVALQACRFDLKHGTASDSPISLKLYCPAHFTGYFPRFKNGPYEKITQNIHVLVKTDLRLSQGPKEPGALSGKGEVLLQSGSAAVAPYEAALATKVSGSVSEFPKRLKLDSELNVSIAHFEKMVALSKNYPWAIPEPLNSLRGSITLHASGKGELLHQGGVVPIALTTRLSSENQKLDLDGEGKLTLKPLAKGFGAHLQYQLKLSDVQLKLPYLNMGAPPRLVPDPRLKTKLTEPTADDSTAFTYEIQILTPNGKPIRIVSNLANDKVPITLSLQGTDKEPIHGSVRVLSFPLELFRRKATVKHIDLKLTQNSDNDQISGDIQVVSTDYTVQILILGLLNSPQIKFISEPPLPEDKVLAVLLFGKTTDSLNPDQSSSVGNTQAAVEDGAISLASMYLLASTPIESVGYDPVSHVFNAKVRLADGTSLNVGSDMTQLNQIGIRKQLGGHWTVTTYLDHPLDPVERSLTAFLEWAKGY